MTTAPSLAMAERSDAAAHLRPFTFQSVACTHPGCVHKLNEDACIDRPHVGLWAVADGMGGHKAGNIASSAVVEALANVSNFTSAFAFRHDVRSLILSANAALFRRSNEELLETIGSTVVTLLAHGGYYACIWAGDSRAYVFRDGRLERITRDHSLVQEMVDAGTLSDSDARTRADRHVITRAVGARSRLDLEGVYGKIEPGDRYLLCSDGLTVVEEAEISVAMNSSSLAVVSAVLMRAAIARGAPDNVTFVVVEATTR